MKCQRCGNEYCYYCETCQERVLLVPDHLSELLKAAAHERERLRDILLSRFGGDVSSTGHGIRTIITGVCGAPGPDVDDTIELGDPDVIDLTRTDVCETCVERSVREADATRALAVRLRDALTPFGRLPPVETSPVCAGDGVRESVFVRIGDVRAARDLIDSAQVRALDGPIPGASKPGPCLYCGMYDGKHAKRCPDRPRGGPTEDAGMNEPSVGGGTT